MSAGDLALVVAVVMCALGFAALVVVLMKVRDGVAALQAEVEMLRAETRPLLSDLRASTDEARQTMQTARADLDRFDRVLGSAEAVSDAVHDSSRVAGRLFSTPVIKAAGLAAGARRAGERLRKGDRRPELVEVIDIDALDEKGTAS